MAAVRRWTRRWRRRRREDLAAYARTLATKRHRNVTLAAEAVTASRAFTEEEARAASPPLVDIVAADLPDLLRQLNGRTITRFDGTSTCSTTEGARDRRCRHDAAPARAERGCEPQRRVPAPQPRHAGADDRVVESGRDPAWCGRRCGAAPGVLRVLSAARQLRRTSAHPLRPAAARSRSQGHELWPADGRRTGQRDLRIDDSDGLAAARDAAQSPRRAAGRRSASRRFTMFLVRLAVAAQR